MNCIFLIPTKIEYLYLTAEIKKNYPHLFLSNKIKVIQNGCGKRIKKFIEDNLQILNNNKIILSATAGALSPQLHFGDIIIPNKIITAHNEILWANDQIYKLNVKFATIFTSTKLVCEPTQKNMLYSKYNAEAVDMESYYAAIACNKYNLNLQIIKIILDEYDESLIKINANYGITSMKDKIKNLERAQKIFKSRMIEISKIIANIINFICI
jgi:nucleoside phosphorylase